MLNRTKLSTALVVASAVLAPWAAADTPPQPALRFVVVDGQGRQDALAVASPSDRINLVFDPGAVNRLVERRFKARADLSPERLDNFANVARALAQAVRSEVSDFAEPPADPNLVEVSGSVRDEARAAGIAAFFDSFESIPLLPEARVSTGAHTAAMLAAQAASSQSKASQTLAQSAELPSLLRQLSQVQLSYTVVLERDPTRPSETPLSSPLVPDEATWTKLRGIVEENREITEPAVRAYFERFFAAQMRSQFEELEGRIRSFLEESESPGSERAAVEAWLADVKSLLTRATTLPPTTLSTELTALQTAGLELINGVLSPLQSDLNRFLDATGTWFMAFRESLGFERSFQEVARITRELENDLAEQQNVLMGFEIERGDRVFATLEAIAPGMASSETLAQTPYLHLFDPGPFRRDIVVPQVIFPLGKGDVQESIGAGYTAMFHFPRGRSSVRQYETPDFGIGVNFSVSPRSNSGDYGVGVGLAFGLLNNALTFGAGYDLGEQNVYAFFGVGFSVGTGGP